MTSPRRRGGVAVPLQVGRGKRRARLALLPPREPQTTQTRRSPARARTEPKAARLLLEERGRARARGHGRTAAALRLEMSASFVSRLLLFVSICAAKSLPEPGAVGQQVAGVQLMEVVIRPIREERNLQLSSTAGDWSAW
ncbi:hypothetical protein EYF80_020834 [Liparis tanakae]|uniref:Uncharacterized protein n=1 Tax=Liparis tanakae TaxID=230148 RepID=A0A4Z2HVH9_9TELE|nr:hypothetical protein EYF80_020834 [Liparis tanakae]